MIKRFLGTLAALLVVSVPTSAQSPVTVKHLPVVPRKPLAPVGVSPKQARAGGNWIRLNTHLLGTIGESTWVNLAQAVNIRFYQTGKTTFASIGIGGSSYISTSDPVEIQALRLYVQAHQTR